VKHNFRNFTIERPALALVQAPAYWGNSTIVRVNSVFDPNYASVGVYNTSAALYLYMSKFYQRYRVMKAVITYTITQRDLLVLSPVLPAVSPAKLEFVVGACLQNSTANTLYSDWTNLVTDPKMKTKSMFLTTTYDQPMGRCKLRVVFKEKSWFGTSGEDDHGALVGFNPTSFVCSGVYSAVKDLAWPLESYPNLNVEQNLTMWVEWSQPYSVMNMPADAEILQIPN